MAQDHYHPAGQRLYPSREEDHSNFEAFGLPIMHLAPNYFKMAAMEKLLSFVKNRDLKPLVVRPYSRKDNIHSIIPL